MSQNQGTRYSICEYLEAWCWHYYIVIGKLVSWITQGTWREVIPRLDLHRSRQPLDKRGPVCASVTAWTAALHKILFTARTGERLQQQSSPEAGKSADLATLRERPGRGSGTIIIILPPPPPKPFIHHQYLYCSQSLSGIQPADDNRLLVHKRMIKRQ